MKSSRRKFLHLAAGVAALPAVSRLARRKPIVAAVRIIVALPLAAASTSPRAA